MANNDDKGNKLLDNISKLPPPINGIVTIILLPIIIIICISVIITAIAGLFKGKKIRKEIDKNEGTKNADWIKRRNMLIR